MSGAVLGGGCCFLFGSCNWQLYFTKQSGCVRTRQRSGWVTWYLVSTRQATLVNVCVYVCVCIKPHPVARKAHKWPTLMQRVTRWKTAKDDDRNVQFKRGARVIRVGGIYMRGCQGQCCCTTPHQEQSTEDKNAPRVLQMHFWDVQLWWLTAQWFSLQQKRATFGQTSVCFFGQVCSMFIRGISHCSTYLNQFFQCESVVIVIKE